MLASWACASTYTNWHGPILINWVNIYQVLSRTRWKQQVTILKGSRTYQSDQTRSQARDKLCLCYGRRTVKLLWHIQPPSLASCLTAFLIASSLLAEWELIPASGLPPAQERCTSSPARGGECPFCHANYGISYQSFRALASDWLRDGLWWTLNTE